MGAEAGVVHQQIRQQAPGADGIEDPPGRPGCGQVLDQEFGAGQFAGELLEPVAAARDQHDFGATAGKLPGKYFADAHGGTGHQDGFLGEIKRGFHALEYCDGVPGWEWAALVS